MANVILPPGWRIPDREASPESVFFNRRAFLKKSGLGLAALGLGACGTEFTPSELDGNTDAPLAGVGCDGPSILHPLQPICSSPTADLYPVLRNLEFDTPPGGLTARLSAAVHNNFYEFIGTLDNVNLVWPYTGPFNVWPWSVEVAGEAELTGVFDVSELEREFGLEERVYRHRCVERWSMVVPWIGYPLAKLIDKFRPLSSANYVRFVSFNRPEEAVGQRIQPDFPWPYYEALRLDEARNELAFVATGVYGEPLPKQHGAPWRLAIPWKYGFKSPKSIVNFDIPGVPEDYIHRVGRTARAELTGEAFTLVSLEDEGSLRRIERAVGSKINRVHLEDFSYEAAREAAPRTPTAGRHGTDRTKKRGNWARGAAKGPKKNANRAPSPEANQGRNQSTGGGGRSRNQSRRRARR